MHPVGVIENSTLSLVKNRKNQVALYLIYFGIGYNVREYIELIKEILFAK